MGSCISHPTNGLQTQGLSALAPQAEKRDVLTRWIHFPEADHDPTWTSPASRNNYHRFPIIQHHNKVYL